jgi:hypothetical protein
MMTVGDIRRQLEGVPDEAVIYAEIETEIEDLCCAKVLGFRLRSFDGFPVLGVVVRVTEEDECDLCSDDDEEEDGEAWEVDADRREVAEIYSMTRSVPSTEVKVDRTPQSPESGSDA